MSEIELYSQNNKVVFKDNQLRFMIPAKEYSLTQRKIINYIISEISPHDNEFTLKKIKLSKLSSSMKDRKTRVLQEALKLDSESGKFKVPGTKSWVSWFNEIIEDDNYFIYKMNDTLKTYLLNLREKYETYFFNLNDYFKIRSAKAQALYEILISIKNYDDMFKINFNKFKEVLSYSDGYKNNDITRDLKKHNNFFEKELGFSFFYKVKKENDEWFIYLKVINNQGEDHEHR